MQGDCPLNPVTACAVITEEKQMKKDITRDKRTTFRMNADEYTSMTEAAEQCGMDLSTYIRSRVTKDIQRIVYDPDMTAELRTYRDIIRKLAADLGAIRQRAERDNYVHQEELEAAHKILKSIYTKMAEIENRILQYREALHNGDHQTS